MSHGREGSATSYDAGFAALREGYANRLPGRIRKIVAAIRGARRHGGRCDAAGPLVHQLKGNAGVFGLPAVGAAAAQLDRALTALRDGDDGSRAARWTAVDAALAELLAAIDEMRAPAEHLPPGVATTRVLVVDADASFLTGVAVVGKQLLVEVVTALSAESALASAWHAPPSVALIDAALPGAGALARALRAVEGCETLPIAFVSAGGGLDQRLLAMHAGGALFLEKPLDAERLGGAVHQLTAYRRARASVLVIDDDPEFRDWAVLRLAQANIRASAIAGAEGLLAALAAEPPDLVLLDEVMPHVRGASVCRLLRADPRWQDLPVLFVSADATAANRVAAFAAGADDFLVKPLAFTELVARVEMRLDRASRRRERSERDLLTGLLLRRGFIDRMGTRLAEIQQSSRALSVVLIDLDNFKRVNDDHGHPVGDRVLGTLGHLLLSRFRVDDVRARWGGEEFALGFPDQGPTEATVLVDRVLKEFTAIDFASDDGAVFHEGFSAGIAGYPADGLTLEALLRAADRRLYLAKTGGRARVVAHE